MNTENRLKNDYSYHQYKCIDKETGKITGVGYVAEDNFKDWCDKNGVKIDSGYTKNTRSYEEHGVDCYLGDEREHIQIKCCCTPVRNAESLVDNETGAYKYAGQTPMVPKGQGNKVKRLLRKKGIETEVKELPSTYKENQETLYRGFKSLKIDARRVMKGNVGKYLGCISLGGLAYASIKSFNTDKEKRSVKMYLRNFCIGAGYSSVIAGLGFCLQLGALQMMRPVRC